MRAATETEAAEADPTELAVVDRDPEPERVFRSNDRGLLTGATGREGAETTGREGVLGLLLERLNEEPNGDRLDEVPLVELARDVSDDP